MSSYSTRNQEVIRELQSAEVKVRIAWRYGDPQAADRMSAFADWFEDVWLEVDDLDDDNEIWQSTVQVALETCEDLMLLDYIPPESFLKYVVRMRYKLVPDGVWYDWPYDVSDLLESDDESDGGMMFHLEL